ncbi:MAG TPA: polysaccharide deacetylase family protein [Acidimicrobiales bacterium]
MSVSTSRRSRFAGRLGSAVLLVAAILYVAAVAGVAIVPELPKHPVRVAEQHEPPTVHLPESELMRYREFAASPITSGAPVILALHDVRPDTDNLYTVSPTRLAEYLTMLKEAGFHTVGQEELVAWVNGAELPPRSVVLTFDDGPQGLWEYADPILEAHGMSAIAYIITDAVTDAATGYHLSWAEIEEMWRSGRWDLGSHTASLHRRVHLDDINEEGSAMVHRERIPDENRLETAAEFEERVRTDLARSKQAFVSRGLPEPTTFAWPFSENQSRTGDVATATRAHEIVGSMFDVQVISVFGNTKRSAPVSELDRAAAVIPRISVVSEMTAPQLFDSIVASLTAGAATPTVPQQ